MFQILKRNALRWPAKRRINSISAQAYGSNAWRFALPPIDEPVPHSKMRAIKQINDTARIPQKRDQNNAQPHGSDR
jgi:hypothetical protein